MTCEGHISVEFNTRKQNVIILYAGPVDNSDDFVKVGFLQQI